MSFTDVSLFCFEKGRNLCACVGERERDGNSGLKEKLGGGQGEVAWVGDGEEKYTGRTEKREIAKYKGSWIF